MHSIDLVMMYIILISQWNQHGITFLHGITSLGAFPLLHASAAPGVAPPNPTSSSSSPHLFLLRQPLCLTPNLPFIPLLLFQTSRPTSPLLLRWRTSNTRRGRSFSKFTVDHIRLSTTSFHRIKPRRRCQQPVMKELWLTLDAMVLQWIYATISSDLLHTILEPDSTAGLGFKPDPPHVSFWVTHLIIVATNAMICPQTKSSSVAM